jgi:hypothetical protein
LNVFRFYARSKVIQHETFMKNHSKVKSTNKHSICKCLNQVGQLQFECVCNPPIHLCIIKEPKQETLQNRIIIYGIFFSNSFDIAQLSSILITTITIKDKSWVGEGITRVFKISTAIKISKE